MKNFIKFLVGFLVGVSLFYFVVQETGIETILNAALLFRGWKGISILLLTLLIVLVGAYRWQGILKSEGENISLLTATRYLVKGFTVDFLTPFSLFGGEAVRIYFMSREVSPVKSAFSCITDKIMDATTHFFFLVLGTFLLVFYGTSPHEGLLFYAGGVIVFIFLALILFYIRVLRRKSFLHWIFGLFRISKKYFRDNENGKSIMEVEKKVILFFTSRKKEFAKGMALSFLRHFLFLLRVFLIVFFLVGSIDPGVAAVIYGLAILSMLLPIPAALGGMEIILGLGFTALGFGFFPGVSAAIALRGADLVVCLLGVILFINFSFISFFQKLNLLSKK